MGIITALRPQKRNPERINVYIDGRFALGLTMAAAASLQVGQALDDSDLDRLQDRETIEKAKESARRYLSHRPRSEAEVRRNLAKKNYDPPVIDLVIDYLTGVHLIDDEAFARYWVDQRETFKPRSPLALRQELARKGVDRRVIERALSAVDETAAAQRAAQQRVHRWASLPKEAFYAKMGRYLQSRGFNYDIVREVTDEMWRELDEPGE